MNYFSIDHLIVYTSLLVTLIVGLRAGRGIQTIQEYAVGNRMFGTSVLVFTYLATNLAGSDVLNNASMVFNEGIIVTFSFFGFFIAEMLMALFFAHKIVTFHHCFTIGDLMREFYGDYGGVITGVLALLQSIILAGMELVALGIVCESLLGIQPLAGIVVGGIILAAYAAHGGIKAVVTTDVLQFITLMIGIPLLAYIAIHKAGGLQVLFTAVPTEKLTIVHHKHFYYYFVFFLSSGIFPSGLIDPAIIQRMLMAKNARQLRNQFFITSVSNPCFQVIIMLVGLAGWKLYPHIESNTIVPHIIHELLPQGMKGLTIAGLFSLSMSTVDSYLHIAGLTLVHDVIRPICKKHNLQISQEHRWAQLATLLLGFLAIAIALSTNNMFELFLDSLACTGPILMFPLLSSIFGLKPEKKAFYIAMFVTVGVWGGCTLLLPEDYNYLSTLISILTNGITFFFSHFWINRGFKMVDRTPKQYLSEFKQADACLNGLLRKLCAYVQKQLQRSEAPYSLAGILCLLNLTIPHLLCNNVIKAHPKYLMVIHSIGAFLAVLLVLKEKWSPSFQVKFMPILFHLTLLYCLPFTSMLMCIISQVNSSFLANILLSLTFLVVLADLGMALLLGIVGIGLSLLFYYHFGSIACSLHMTAPRLGNLQVFVSLLFIIYFLRRKQKQIHQIEQKMEQLCQRHHLLQSDYLHRLQYQALQKKQLEIQKDPLRLAKQALISLAGSHASEALLAQKGLEQLNSFINYYKASFYQTMDALRLHSRAISLTDLLVQLNSYINDKDCTERIRIHLLTQQKTITCDVEKIIQLLASQIQSWFYDRMAMVTLSIQDTELFYQLQAVPTKDYTRKLPALGFLLTQSADIERIQPYYQGTTLPTSLEVPKTAMELPERNQKQLIEAHYGYQAYSPHGAKLFVLPIEVDKIRAAVVDQDPMPSEVPLDTPASITLERAFLQRLLETSCLLDFTIAREAIDMIKQVHQGQFRKSGEPFYTHPLMVAIILLTMTQDPDTVLAALFHDVVEDTPVHLEQLAYQYGQKVAWLVQKVTNVDPTGKKTKLTAIEIHEQLAASSDGYAVMIKLADRLHNVRTWGFHPLDKQRRIAQETLDFYLPLAASLEGVGVQLVVKELRTTCEAILATG